MYIPKDIKQLILSYVKFCKICNKYRISREVYANILLNNKIICCKYCYTNYTRYPYIYSDTIQSK